MLDDLRSSFEDEDLGVEFEEDEFADFDFEGQVIAEAAPKKFLGMTAMERMILSIFLFLNVFVLGLALLVATNRIQL
ncbi:MAG: hypothetical protein D6712_02705 [Chloroflexi bacterium]|nr:MAG: hypothetical protein D6712_02705 [Chloroflexota bacterium]